MLEKIYENSLAFYEMVKTTTYLCNNPNGAYRKDAGKIIEVIGKAYGLNDELIAFIQKEIIEDLSAIETDEDVRTFQSLKQDEHAKVDVTNPLLKFKYNALNEIFGLDYRTIQLNKVWFDYSYPNDYVAKIRYDELSSSCSSGIIDINKAVALMNYLGIGTTKDVKAAERKLKQCMYWGDLASIKLLAFIEKENKNEECSLIYEDLFSLSSYLNEGITVLPKEVKDNHNPKTVDLFVLISSIKHDIIHRFDVNRIDFSFTEIMMDDEIPHFKKIRYINEYRQLSWIDASNSSTEATPKMGFKVEEE